MQTETSHKPASSLSMLIAALILISVCLVSACKKEDPLSVAAKINPRAMPTMTTHNVMTVISDSGIPQYRMVCPTWYVYDDIDTPLWILPKGPYLEKFDADYNIIFTVAADSAVNNRLEQRWYLYGNVEFNELPELLILTPQLVWDQREQKIYSDAFIHIEQPDKIIEGYGFVGYTNSRGTLQSYELRKPTAVLPFDKDKIMGADRTIAPTEFNPALMVDTTGMVVRHAPSNLPPPSGLVHD
ncbi:MAG: LPS export ABC transporter periplasmic protein LptC [Prevotella sp.]|nr:LPS export ABC transporter periplasmic protein LptC [Prevotella sp.]MCM1075711.1 LPS export ABC transporter periplasmic protein LptC [Ruminococcus sp.]